MLDKTSLMNFSCEIRSSKCIQVSKGFLAVYMGCGEGELRLDLSKIDAIMDWSIDIEVVLESDTIIPANGICGSYKSVTLAFIPVVCSAITVCGGVDSIPTNIGERIIHPCKIGDTFALFTIYACMLKIFIWIRGFLGADQCWRRYFVNFSSIVDHLHSLAVVQKVL